MVLAKSINDASWYQFRVGLEYFAKVFEKITIVVNPQYISQEGSSWGAIVKKTLSTSNSPDSFYMGEWLML